MNISHKLPILIFVLLLWSGYAAADTTEIWVFPIGASGKLVSPVLPGSSDLETISQLNQRTLRTVNGYLGYCKFEEDGSVNFFGPKGKHLFYHPSSAHPWSVFEKENGLHEGLLYSSGGQLCLGLAEDVYANLIQD